MTAPKSTRRPEYDGLSDEHDEFADAQWAKDVAHAVTACNKMMTVDLTEWELVSAQNNLMFFLRRKTLPDPGSMT